MTLKFSECTLAFKYRTFDEKGNVSGGPMYYIQRGLGKGWKWMAILFAFLTIVGSFGSGNMNQSNTVALSAAKNFHAPDWLVGLIISGLVALVILGGIRRIGAVSARVMPTMAVLYILGALFILGANIPKLPGIFAEIISDAWSPKAAFGGSAAGLWNFTLLWGIKRALFSNEAGQGSAPIAHAAARTKEPVREGIVALLEPFIDTLMICTLTGLVIVVTGVWNQKKDETRRLDPDKVSVYQQVMVDETWPDVQNDLIENRRTNVEISDITKDWWIPYMTKRLSDDSLKTYQFMSHQTIIRDGKSEALLFEVNDAFIENAILMKDENPYNGWFVMDDQKIIRDKDGERLELMIQGRSLQNSSELTEWAFETGFGKMGKVGTYIVAFCVFLFGFSTIISWSYYGDRCIEYLFGVRYVIIYRIIYVGFTFMGAKLALETVWAYGDMALGAMMVPNLIAVLLLSGKLIPLTRDYFSRKHKRYK
jgi:AGCS family alanine or glycine:cation symporter